MATHEFAGWMERRGPTVDFNWQKRWVVLHEGKLETFADEACAKRKATMELQPRSTAVPFKARNAPGEAALYSHQRPFGFVVDLEPQAGKGRRMAYFDPLHQEGLDQWTQAIHQSVRQVEQLLKDEAAAARQLVRDLVWRCCARPGYVADRRVARHLLRGIFRKVCEEEGVKQAPGSQEELSVLLPMIGSDQKKAAKAVRRNSALLQHLPQEFRADRDVVMAAVEGDPLALAHADASIKADRDVVFAAVTKDGMALEHTSAELKADVDIVLAATLRSPEAIRFASAEIKDQEAMTVF
ncbi:unnamed protein product [Effrenium voratum]|uniref:PH domain-containing protein n=1 Tax=Effrenium voratum TaxID=2562239 RepID=A0AA36HWX0_9DINO|nr:unnamed protein product [Effrenium voratum]CAJ1422790.1 unnamed protein product [Effrenium voratum]